MPIKKGDQIAVTVTKEWAEAVGPVSWLHYFSANDTATSRLFFAKLVSVTDSEGLWIESAEEVPPGKRDTADEMLVPWSFIFAIQTSAYFQSDRETMGFVKSD